MSLPGTPTSRAPSRFTTRGVRPELRTARWEAHNAAALIGITCRCPPRTTLEASEQVVPVGALRLARVTAGPHETERGPATIGHIPAGAIAVYLALRGRSSYRSTDLRRALRPGEMLVVDADTACRRGFAGPMEELVVTVPRRVAHEIGLDVVARQAAVLPVTGPGGSEDAQALSRSVHAALAGGPVPGSEELLGLLERLARSRPPAGAELDAVAAYVTAHLHDPDLSAPRVAAAAGMSTRQLSRLLAAAGTTLPRYVRRRRLELARELLSDPHAPPVGEVARRVGLCSLSRFSVAFREEFGVRPGDLRQAAGQASGGPLSRFGQDDDVTPPPM